MPPFAICNETFGDWPWERVCRFVADTGYDGIEIAPFTFGESVEAIPPARRHEIGRIAEECGLRIAGLHWLLASPKGLHIHTRHATVRAQTVEYLRALIHFAALATEEAARTDSLRAGAARSILGGSPDAAVETLLTRMQGDRAFATRAGREDLLQAFALLPADDTRVAGWRRRLAAVLN